MFIEFAQNLHKIHIPSHTIAHVVIYCGRQFRAHFPCISHELHAHFAWKLFRQMDTIVHVNVAVPQIAAGLTSLGSMCPR